MQTELQPGTLVYEAGYPEALSIFLRFSIEPTHGRVAWLLPLDNIKPGVPEAKWTDVRYIRPAQLDHPVRVQVLREMTLPARRTNVIRRIFGWRDGR